MRQDIARAYNCFKREHDRVRAACVKNLVQNGRHLERLFKLASVFGGHAHRFRDTFGVELLRARVPIVQ
jgi:hypothetical protein